MNNDELFYFGFGMAVASSYLLWLLALTKHEQNLVGCVAVVGLAMATGSIISDVLVRWKERRKLKASVYSDWDKVDEKPEPPTGAYGKSFHSLNIRELVGNMKDEKCPRCGGPFWRKAGLEYLDKFGNKVQLWRCVACDYNEERFKE